MIKITIVEEKVARNNKKFLSIGTQDGEFYGLWDSKCFDDFKDKEGQEVDLTAMGYKIEVRGEYKNIVKADAQPYKTKDQKIADYAQKRTSSIEKQARQRDECYAKHAAAMLIAAQIGAGKLSLDNEKLVEYTLDLANKLLHSEMNPF